jgi:hypothetical protein
MNMRIGSQALILATALGVLIPVVGCHVEVDKGKNGEDKNVRIETPVGGLHVRSDQTSAVDLGLPVYPGAQIAPDGDGDKSADVHLGFGPWQMHVRVVTYSSPDPQDKVLAFYKSAMGRFGTVIECQGNQPVGSPTVTTEGLTCREDSHTHINVNGNNGNIADESGLSLRAGSRHHQRILAFKSTANGTKYSLVELELPTSGSDNDKNSSSD